MGPGSENEETGSQNNESNDGVSPLVMNFTTSVLEHDFVSEQCKWNCPLMVWNAPSWPLKGDNWKIQDTAMVRKGTTCSTAITTVFDTGELALSKILTFCVFHFF